MILYVIRLNTNITYKYKIKIEKNPSSLEKLDFT